MEALEHASNPTESISPTNAEAYWNPRGDSSVALPSESDQLPGGCFPTQEPKRYPTVEEMLAKGANFISVYKTYADVYELAPEAHMFVALSLLAAVLNRNGIIIRQGATRATLDLWMLLLSPSGSGRDTCLRPARRILELADLKIIRDEDFGSPEAAKQQLAEHPCGLYLWPEFSTVMKKFGDGRFSDLREWITHLYDSLVVPAGIHYVKHPGKPSADTAPIDFKQAPRLNILATCARDYLTSNLQIEDTTVGFLPRWTIADLPDSDQSIAEPREHDPRPEKFLAEFFQRASQIHGQPDFSEVKSLYNDWYNTTRPRMKGPLLGPFFNRLRTQVLKFAVLFEVSRSLLLRVSPSSMKDALWLADRLQKSITQFAERGLSKASGQLSLIEDFIKEARVAGCSRSEITRKFRCMADDLDRRLRMLIEGGIVVRFWRKSKGRPAEILVHESFAEKHRAQYPADSETYPSG